MKNWQRRGLGILAIGGGAVGLSSAVQSVLNGGVHAPFPMFVFALALAFFLWGISCGVQMLEGVPSAEFQNALFWMVQTPLLQTPVFGYSVFSAVQLQVFAKFAPLEVGFFGSAFGAQFGLNFGQPGARTLIGINLVALGLALWLVRWRESVEATTVGDATHK